MTYAVNDVCDLIKKHIPQLSNNTLSILIRDIETYPKDSGAGSYGMQCDREEWLSVLDALKKEYEQRKEESR